jgi:methylmalonyl-CoA epimerase
MPTVSRLDHIAIAVRDLDAGIDKWTTLLGAELVAKQKITLQGHKVEAAYLKIGDAIIVLDGAADPEGFIARFIERRGEGLHHIAVSVDDLDTYVAGVEQAGVSIPHREQVGPLRREVLLSPKDTCGVVVQVIEWKEPDAPTLDERIRRLTRFLGTQGG